MKNSLRNKFCIRPSAVTVAIVGFAVGFLVKTAVYGRFRFLVPVVNHVHSKL